jgi:hypothetical protein
MTGADVDVIKDLEIEGRRRADLAHFDVAFFVLADRHRRIGQIRDRLHEGADPGLQLLQAVTAGFEFVGNAADFCHHGRRVFALPLQHADLLRQCIALGLQFFRAGLYLFALAFELVEAVNVEREFARGQTGGDAGDVFAEQLNIDHGVHRGNF